MSVPDNQTQLCDAYRFDHFEVRLQSEILLLNGERIRIQDLPFRLLLALLETPGKVVSSDELGRRLGGPKSYLELGSLRVAATKLREALGDSATTPRFIKTVSGQGYKFIADVVPVVKEVAIEVPGPDAPVEGLSPSPLALPVEAEFERGSQMPRMASLGLLVIAVLLVSGIIGAATLAKFSLYGNQHRTVAGNHDTIVLGGFTNNTADHGMDGTLSSAFQVKMEESPYLRLASNRKFAGLVKNSETATLGEELNACRTLIGKILLRGQLASRKSGQQVEITAWDCSDGEQLATRTVDADSKAQILPALNLAAEEMRRQLGEPDDSLQKFNVPLGQATTSSLAALRAFTQGEEKRDQGLELESIQDYKLAADLDPQFALAYARLGAIYFNTGEYALSRESFQMAFDLRGRTTDRERLYITADYYGFATGEVRRATEAYELWRKIYPQDIAPINNLAMEYLLVGRPEDAVDLARTAIQLDLPSSLPYGTWSDVYLKNGDYASLNTLCRGSLGRASDATVLHVHCFQGAFAQDDEAGMQQQLDWAHKKTQDCLLLQEAAIVALSRGRAAESWRLFSQAKESALKNNLVEFAAGTAINEAGFRADLGFSAEARKEVLDALKLAPHGALTQAFAALVLARAGDSARANAEAAKATAQSPLDTILNSAILASARSAMQLQELQPEAALKSLEETRPYDFNDFMYLAPSYYRGLAYLQAKHPQDAAREFRRVLDHRVLVPDSPYILLSQFELGRALQLSGDNVHAVLAYRNMEAIWKDADPSFPPLQQMHIFEHQLTPGFSK